MPLKHSTETALIVVLAIAIATVGIVLSLLPDLPQGLYYWLALFIATGLYPLVLTPVFRENRADYEFRLLHWVPAAMTALWAILQVVGLFIDGTSDLMGWFRFLWCLPLVGIGFLLLIIFCNAVLRRRQLRISLLILAFILFAGFATVASSKRWNERLQAYLTHEDVHVPLDDASVSSGEVIAMASSSSSRASQVVGRSSSSVRTSSSARTSSSSKMSSSSRSSSSSKQGGAIGKNVKDLPKPKPPVKADPAPKLPKSGPETAAGVIAILGLYCGVLQVRVIKREDMVG